MLNCLANSVAMMIARSACSSRKATLRLRRLAKARIVLPRGPRSSSKNKVRQTWLKWRARRLAQLYRDMRRDIAEVRQDARLYLAAAALFASREMQQELRPTLPARGDFADAMLQLGIDAELYGDDAHLILLRPHSLAPLTSLAAQAVNLQLAEAPEVDQYFGGEAGQRGPKEVTGSLFSHEPLSLRLPSFDAASPFGPENTQTWLLSHVSPAGAHNRRRFVHSLAALDAQSIVDGGWMALMGQEESLRSFIDVYRRLPAEHFETIFPGPSAAKELVAAARFAGSGAKAPGADPAQPGKSTQPVIVRKLTTKERTYIYLLNDSPWPVAATLDLAAPYDCRIEPLGHIQQQPLSRQGQKAQWSISLEPYGLAAAALSSADARIESCNVVLDRTVKTLLNEQLADMSRHVNALREPPPLPVLSNPGFELGDGQNPLPGWVATQGAAIEPDGSQSHSGRQSLRLRRSPSDRAHACVRSEPFDPPRRGGWRGGRG